MCNEDGLYIVIVCAAILIVGMLLGGIVQVGIDDVKIDNLMIYIDTLEKYNTVDLSSVNTTLENDEIVAWGETTKLRNKDV
jgi:hypothetical protein